MSSNPVMQPSTTTTKSSTPTQQVGSTWSNSGNLNIDLECLSLSNSKGKPKDSAPSMNQLANPMSPTANVTFNSGMNLFGPRPNMMVPSSPHTPTGLHQQFPSAQFASFK